MLTPRFEITQTDADVTIIVHAPYANIKDADVCADGTDVMFYASPYYLRLQLPGEVKENDWSSEASKFSYDCDKSKFSIILSKVNKGEHFENLDMISTLLASSRKKSNFIPNIEVIGNPSANAADIVESLDDTSNNSGDNWFLPQSNPTENATILLDSPKYGFANKISGALIAFEASWLKEIIDLPSPDTTPEVERKRLQEDCELEDFSEEHYMADLMQSEYIQQYITYTAEWDTLQKDEVKFSDAEVDLLKELPNKEYLLDAGEIEKLCLNVADILYGSCYNHRTTMGENTVESSWTINKLSSTLCWFRTFTSMDEVMTACFRRSLCYPLFRNWELSMKVFEDVKKVVALGKKYVIKRFCEIHNLFNTSHESRYVLNQLYIKDFLIWLQKSPESLIESLHSQLNNIHPDKANVEFDLVELEAAAHSVQEEGFVIENNHNTVSDDIIRQIGELSLNNIEEEKLSSSSSSTDSSDTDSESSTTSSSTTSSNNSTLDSDDFSEPE